MDRVQPSKKHLATWIRGVKMHMPVKSTPRILALGNNPTRTDPDAQRYSVQHYLQQQEIGNNLIAHR